jgi:hypothetical protein
MSKDAVSDKPRSYLTVLICTLISAIVYYLFNHYTHVEKGTFYILGTVVLFALYTGACIGAILLADNVKDYGNTARKCVVGMAVILFLWFGGWSAFSNEEVKPGSPQMEDVR